MGGWTDEGMDGWTDASLFHLYPFLHFSANATKKPIVHCKDFGSTKPRARSPSDTFA